jgi:hypothetical protein
MHVLSLAEALLLMLMLLNPAVVLPDPLQCSYVKHPPRPPEHAWWISSRQPSIRPPTAPNKCLLSEHMHCKHAHTVYNVRQNHSNHRHTARGSHAAPCALKAMFSAAYCLLADCYKTHIISEARTATAAAAAEVHFAAAAAASAELAPLQVQQQQQALHQQAL